MIHYIYKIHFLCGYPSGRYYIGKRSYHGNDISKDKYTGSGDFCVEYFKKYKPIAGQTYIKEILEINPSKKINTDRENFWVGDLWKSDPLCMNKIPGGIDRSFQKLNIKVQQFDLKGNLIKLWDDITDACHEYSNNIFHCCRGEYNTSDGYIWRFENDPFDKYYIPTKISESKHSWVKVNQYDLNGNYIKTWDSATLAADNYSSSKSRADNLRDAIYGKSKTWKGYQWRHYKGNTDNIAPIKDHVLKEKPIYQYSLDGTYLKTWKSLAEVCKEYGWNAANISRCALNKCNNSYGYKWSYILLNNKTNDDK